ncbi:hypothetical protein [Paracoccus sp. NSM]|uniref:hypothetical protein n=1 Tax=Paracoccus sp. NSM TaxID=3457784 RepID=UPI004035908D
MIRTDMQRRDPAHQVLVEDMGTARVMHHGFEGFLIGVLMRMVMSPATAIFRSGHAKHPQKDVSPKNPPG